MARIFFTVPLASRTERLTRISSTNDIYLLHFFPVDLFNVSQIGYIGPMLFKYTAGVRVYF
jgi:hypothetical protein